MCIYIAVIFSYNIPNILVVMRGISVCDASAQSSVCLIFVCHRVTEPPDEVLLQLEVMSDFNLVVELEAVEGATVEGAATADCWEAAEATAELVVGTLLVVTGTAAVAV